MIKAKQKGSTLDISRGDGGGWSWDGWTKGGEGFPIPTAKLGLWIFLGAVTMLFAALTSAYIVRMSLPDWRNVPKPPILWFNTAVLILSSATMQWAWNLARRGNIDSLRNGLFATVALGALFVAGQLLAWRQLVAAGVYLQTNPASSFFYLLTAAHGLHLLGGVVALIWTTVRTWRKGYAPLNYMSVELCVIYWHFLTLIWIWLFLLILLH